MSVTNEHPPVPGCTFCDQYVLFSLDNYWSYWGKSYGQTTDVIGETSNFLLIAGLGALVEGYVLILPKAHYYSTGELPVKEVDELEIIKGRVQEMLLSLYGSASFFEHGVSAEHRAGGCIDHAHIHCFPSKVDFVPYIDPSLPVESVVRLQDIKNTLVHSSSYIYYENHERKLVFSVSKSLSSQYMRKIWAQTLGRDREWDWAVFIGEQNVANTIAKMKGRF